MGVDSIADRKRQTKKKSEKRRREMEKEKGGEGDREQLGDFFLFSPPYPFPNTSESNWTKTVI